MSTLSVRHGWTIRQDDQRACTCTPANPRHTQGWHCVTPAQIEAWTRSADYREHGDGKMPEHARLFAWMWLRFSPEGIKTLATAVK